MNWFVTSFTPTANMPSANLLQTTFNGDETTSSWLHWPVSTHWLFSWTKLLKMTKYGCISYRLFNFSQQKSVNKVMDQEKVGDFWPKRKGIASTTTVKLRLNLYLFQSFVVLQLQQTRGRIRYQHENQIFIQILHPLMVGRGFYK